MKSNFLIFLVALDNEKLWTLFLKTLPCLGGNKLCIYGINDIELLKCGLQMGCQIGKNEKWT